MGNHQPLAGRTALVTGASSGLGFHFAQVLGGAGARVILAARRADALGINRDLLVEAGIQASVWPVDVTDEVRITREIGGVWEENDGIDILVNNAGGATSGAALEMEISDWSRILDLNLTGAFMMARAVAGMMRDGGTGGSIINMASILGIHVKPGLSAYCASKAGLVQLTRSLALEWARFGIRVNALAPGYFPTDINRDYLESAEGQKMRQAIPQRRFGVSSDLNGPLLLLAGDGSAYMTGSVLTVDGGHGLVTA